MQLNLPKGEKVSASLLLRVPNGYGKYLPHLCMAASQLTDYGCWVVRLDNFSWYASKCRAAVLPLTFEFEQEVKFTSHLQPYPLLIFLGWAYRWLASAPPPAAGEVYFAHRIKIQPDPAWREMRTSLPLDIRIDALVYGTPQSIFGQKIQRVLCIGMTNFWLGEGRMNPYSVLKSFKVGVYFSRSWSGQKNAFRQPMSRSFAADAMGSFQLPSLRHVSPLSDQPLFAKAKSRSSQVDTGTNSEQDKMVQSAIKDNRMLLVGSQQASIDKVLSALSRQLQQPIIEIDFAHFKPFAELCAVITQMEQCCDEVANQMQQLSGPIHDVLKEYQAVYSKETTFQEKLLKSLNIDLLLHGIEAGVIKPCLAWCDHKLSACGPCIVHFRNLDSGVGTHEARTSNLALNWLLRRTCSTCPDN